VQCTQPSLFIRGPMADSMAGMALDRTTALQQARRLAIAVLGGSVILLAVVLFFTPAPSILVFLLGLAILGSEFLWAGRLLQRVKSIRKKNPQSESSVVSGQSSVQNPQTDN
jgi:hypothetical protein